VERLNTGEVAAGVTFFAAAGVYVATLLRGVSSADPAEMQTVPTVLGIAHPTTYPLWTLLGYAWTRLPLASPALLMNALSAALFAASGAGAVMLASRLGARPLLAAALAGMTFAYAGLIWSRATQADVHALHTFLMVLVLAAWITAEQTGSRKAALALVGLVGLGLAHHRLMLITGVPIAMWFFVRRLAWLRSPRFAFQVALVGAAPLLLYLYLPLRGDHGAPITNADYSKGWLSAATAFSGNQTVWSRTSIDTWLTSLPTDLRLASHWIGWPALVLALLGGLILVRDRPVVAAGLMWTILAPTYGAANRNLDDVHHRWLIVPLLVVMVLASVGAEHAVRAIISVARRGTRRDGSAMPRLIAGAVIVAALAMPAWAFARGFSRYDRSRDVRDQRNAARILLALKPGAIVWSYWDVRTTLQYERFVAKVRADVEIIDHRAYVRYRSDDDAAVALALANDPRYAHRPLYLIPGVEGEQSEVAALRTRFGVKPVLKLGEPSEALAYHGGGHLYIVERR
jgi:Ca2+/Na+ antiporter